MSDFSWGSKPQPGWSIDLSEYFKKDWSEVATGEFDMDGYTINNVPNPINDDQAANKKYVESYSEPKITTLPIEKWWTNSNTPLVNARAMMSNWWKIVESAVTVVELQNLSSSTSNIQAQLNNKQKKFLSDWIVIQEDWLWVTPLWSYNWQINTTWWWSNVTSVTTWTDTNHKWIVRLTTASAWWRATLSLLANSIWLAGGNIEYRWNLQCLALSNAVDEYIAYLWLGDNVWAWDMNNWVYFVYDRLTSLNRQIRSAAWWVRTNIITSVPVVAGSWVRFWFLCPNAFWNSVSFSINWVIVWTINTNLPTWVNFTNPFIGIKRSAGWWSQSILVDYYNLTQEFITIR